jgi:hypothetical protein
LIDALAVKNRIQEEREKVEYRHIRTLINVFDIVRIVVGGDTMVFPVIEVRPKDITSMG